MRLEQLSSLFIASRLEGDAGTLVTGVQADSRKVRPGDLFLCVPGLVSDGHDFAAKAAEAGAAALVVERDVPVDLPKLFVRDARYAMAAVACRFYGYPSRELKLIGVTGTNGKTTTAAIIEHILRDRGFGTGLMGTINMKIGDRWYDTERTTQEAIDLQMNLRRMRDAGADYAVMEVSSHALELGRVKGCRFRTALFTNLTQDHLDFHKTMEQYRAAKGLFFSRLGNEFADDPDAASYAVLNADDDASAYFAKQTSAQVIRYGLGDGADVRASGVRLTAKGTQFTVTAFGESVDVKMKLVGKFNVYNALGAISSTLVERIPLAAIANSLERVGVVPGRMEAVEGSADFLVVVDYAHTPDGLENALSTVREFCEGRIITVFGCGGERDRTKRPIMGRIAARYSDYVIATSDNPRSEPPEAILGEIEPGIAAEGIGRDRYELIVDRREAIHKAVEMASPNDVVLIAGKGHEPYQIVGGVQLHFDDRLVAQEAIRGRSK
ncbi:UDP-N-acetylmuramoyl-L-alanyl-D-glutamate--2,6-diaminopimelate ligase [Paenibacillus flagellatus]|uniref:UDP-N-acetylmuramoyl-L-alanyl-D-glutamate--2,6-diaminopimelate ligase n=1 Tax=Paenibacillus flagellatus TaxID=2211139 RepID=A0A2V5KXQ2_9BACL|nr:UDP-N-acetylmuramoyl-L-alanyl-D-glutamate--2,6-diaminopimelate ligase [Paenibacillus flagellatus]PYI54656.1 UDP-N-acetylmuramoyl-L-alanyl-D-glutamate--2,6-diaminopimelate ligase [Paenibacillus flagellatus]